MWVTVLSSLFICEGLVISSRTMAFFGVAPLLYYYFWGEQFQRNMHRFWEIQVFIVPLPFQKLLAKWEYDCWYVSFLDGLPCMELLRATTIIVEVEIYAFGVLIIASLMGESFQHQSPTRICLPASIFIARSGAWRYWPFIERTVTYERNSCTGGSNQ